MCCCYAQVLVHADDNIPIRIMNLSDETKTVFTVLQMHTLQI